MPSPTVRVLDGGKEIIEATALRLLEAADSVLPAGASSVSLRFERDGAPVALARIDQVELINRDGHFVQSLESMFALSGGDAVASDVTSVMNAMQPYATQKLGIRVTGADADSFTHSGVVDFYLGQFRLVGTPEPPPSAPDLAVGNIPVTITLLGTSVVFTRVSDADGHFEVPSVPLGHVGFASQTMAGGINYYGQGSCLDEPEAVQCERGADEAPHGRLSSMSNTSGCSVLTGSTPAP